MPLQRTAAGRERKGKERKGTAAVMEDQSTQMEEEGNEREEKTNSHDFEMTPTWRKKKADTRNVRRMCHRCGESKREATAVDRGKREQQK